MTEGAAEALQKKSNAKGRTLNQKHGDFQQAGT